MILTDVAKIEKSPKFCMMGAYENSVATIKSLRAALGHQNTINRFTQHVSLHPVWSAMNEQLHVLKLDVWGKADALPDDLLEKNEPLAIANMSPRIELSEIRDLANKLNFVFIPYAYLNDYATSREDYSTKQLIGQFVAKLPTTHAPYVLCPVGYYNIEKHVNAKEDTPIYAGTNNQQAFMAINMAIPFFRSMQAQIMNVNDRLQHVERNMNAISTEIKNLTTRVEQLEKQAEQEIKLRLQAEAKAREMEKQLEKLKRERFLAEEPLLVGMPKREKDLITGDASCIVGPCWGPDFKDIVFALLNLRKVDGQRKAMSEAAKRWMLN